MCNGGSSHSWYLRKKKEEKKILSNTECLDMQQTLAPLGVGKASVSSVVVLLIFEWRVFARSVEPLFSCLRWFWYVQFEIYIASKLLNVFV